MPTPVTIAVRTTGTTTAKSQLRGVQTQVGGIGTSLKKLVIGGAAIAGVAGLARGFVRAGVAITKTGGEYVNSLNKIQALTGASNKQLDEAARKIEAGAGAYAKMGQTSGDAAAGVVELTKAGVSLKDSLAAVRSTMVLAKAGELDVADASTLVANTLNTFSLKAKDAGRIANGLANAANISSADVSDLAESFKYVSPIAAKSGVSLDQVNAILAELSNSGVKASQAGTGLRKFLLSLQAPSGAAKEVIDDLGISIYDAAGKMLPFPKVVGNLRDSLKGLSQQKQNETLKTIFGLTGITPAQIILKNGVKGLEDYTKGVQRAGAAQKLAEAQSKGLVGTLSQIKANATSTAQELFRVYSPKINAAIQDLIGWLGQNKDAFKDAGNTLKDTLLPPLKLLFDGAKLGAKIIGAIPGPVRDLGIQAGIAALVLPRLTSAVSTTSAKVKQLGADMTYSATRAQRLGGAMRAAAGIGGMLLMAQSAKSSSKAVNVLGETAGAALTGFAVGGPIGAAIGGGVGLLHGLYKATHKSSEEMADAKAKAAAYADQIDRIASASGKAARAETLRLLESKGVVSQARALGISTSDLISATLGHGKAIERVNNAWKKQGSIVAGIEGQNLAKFLSDQGFAIDQHKQKIKEDADAINGVRHNSAEAARATRLINRALEGTGKVKPNLGPWAAVLNAGLDHARGGARKGADDVKKNLRRAGDTKPTTDPWLFGLNGALAKGRGAAARGAADVSRNLRDGTSHARPNLSPFTASFSSVLTNLKSTASSGGSTIGSNLGSGVASGVHSWIDNVASAARSMVASAIAAARAQAKAKSPSRETMKLGHDLGDGLSVGIRARRGKTSHDMAQLMKSILRAAVQGADDLKSALRDRLEKGHLKPEQITKAMRRLSDESKRLEGVATRQRKVNAALADARQKLADLRQTSKDYAASVKDSLVSYASVTGLDSAFNPKAIEAALAARLAKLKQFSTLITQLKAGGLNQQSLDQLIQGGVEGGLAYASAIASGGADAVAQINALQGQIATVAGDVGQTAADNLYAAGLSAADGLVQGLEDRQDALAKVMRRLARRLVAELKDELQIKSPSRVFANLGGMTVEGLKIGVEAGNGRKIGETLARDLTTGFAKPDLTARAAFDQQTVVGGFGTTTHRLELTAQQLTALQRGQTIAVDLNAFLAAGGKLAG